LYSLLDKSVTSADIYGIKKRDEIKSTLHQRALIILNILNLGRQSITLAEIQKYTGYNQRYSAHRLAKRLVETYPEQL
jgi:Transcriptional regulator